MKRAEPSFFNITSAQPTSMQNLLSWFQTISFMICYIEHLWQLQNMFPFNSLPLCERNQYRNIFKLQNFNIFNPHFPASKLLATARLCHKTRTCRYSAFPAPSPQSSSDSTFWNNMWLKQNQAVFLQKTDSSLPLKALKISHDSPTVKIRCKKFV